MQKLINLIAYMDLEVLEDVKKRMARGKSLMDEMPEEIGGIFELAGEVDKSELETIVLPQDLQQFKKNLEDVKVMAQGYPRILSALEKIEAKLFPVLNSKLDDIESLVVTQMREHWILRQSGSSAPKIFQAITNFRALKEEEKTPEALMRLMIEIEGLARASKDARNNPFGRKVMGGSSTLYDDILAKLQEPYEISQAQVLPQALAEQSPEALVSIEQTPKANLEDIDWARERQQQREKRKNRGANSPDRTPPLPSTPEVGGVDTQQSPKASPELSSSSDIDWVSLRQQQRKERQNKKNKSPDRTPSLPSTPEVSRAEAKQSPKVSPEPGSSSTRSEASASAPKGVEENTLPNKEARVHLRLAAMGRQFDLGSLKEALQEEAIKDAKGEEEGGAKPKDEKEEEAKASTFAFVSPVAEEQILQAIETQHDPVSMTQFKKMVAGEDTSAMLKILEYNMRQCERLKHPDPPWRYTRIEPQRLGEKVIIKLEYLPDHVITQNELDQIRKYSLMTRKLSIIGGILTLLDSPAYLTAAPAQKQAIRQYLAKLTNEVNDSRHDNKVGDEKKEINDFIRNLVKGLEEQTSPKPTNIVRDIRRAERYFVAEHNKNQALLSIIHGDNEDIIQLDVELNHQLNEVQKLVYLQIHDEDKPDWFMALSDAERDWYLARIPNPGIDSPAVMEKKWEDFEVLFKSSANTGTPGPSNLRVNVLMVRKEGKLKVLSVSAKGGTPDGYEIPQSERAKHTRDNAEKMVDVLEELGGNNFAKLWGPFFQGAKVQPKIPLLVQSLLSEKVVKAGVELAKADKYLIRNQREAMEGIEREGFEIFYHNDGTNAFSRGNEISMKKDPEFRALVKTANNFLQSVFGELEARDGKESYFTPDLVSLLFSQDKRNPEAQQVFLNKVLAKIEESPHLTSEQKEAVILIIAILDEYHHEKAGESKMSRNKAEYMIALKKMLIEAMGGASSNNCKSGKDRTGQSEAYQHAFTLYMRLYSSGHPLLHFNEEGERRAAFCQWAAILNASGKIQVAAAMNTPGSLGTKATGISMIIDDGIVESGEYSKLYKIFCILAELNKPTDFSNDEAQEATEAKKLDPGSKAESGSRIKREVQEVRGESSSSPREEQRVEQRGSGPGS